MFYALKTLHILILAAKNFCTLFIFIIIISCSQKKLHEIPLQYVYTIKEHGDSLYFSTPDGNIFRIDPNNPDSLNLICSKRGHPLRSLAFTHDNSIYASSYISGVYRIFNDKLAALPYAWHAAWSMKLDSNGKIWLASKSGIYRQTGDTLVRFSKLNEAHDLDFYNGLLAVAHRKGISLYNLQTEECVRSICKDTICWLVRSYDSLLIGGGVQFCALINQDNHKAIRVGNRYNIPWDCTRTIEGDLYLASQQGLFLIRSGSTEASCIGYHGKCIKSVFADKKNRVWVGRYYN